jgi:Holliday junction DNA helicase RuvB
MLYLAMEDFRVDIVVGKGPGATAIPLELPPFTVVGATTRSGLLPAPLRDRFGFTGHLDFYETADLVTILRRSAGLARGRADDAGHREIAGRRAAHPASPTACCAGCVTGPRSTARAVVDLAAAQEALALFDVDVRGLDRLDRAVLDALCRRFGGGPVGVSNLAVAVGEEADTVETVAEPFLVREGSSCAPPVAGPRPPSRGSTSASPRRASGGIPGVVADPRRRRDRFGT